MDTAIPITSNFQLEYELYQEPSDSGVNLNFASCIPRHVKTSVARQSFLRAIDLSLDIRAEERSRCKMSDLLRGIIFQKQKFRGQRAKLDIRLKG